MNQLEFCERVRACTPKLWRISYAILRNGADCDDALQEALLRAWRHIPTLRDSALFETWLTRILINESRRLLKKRAQTASPDIPVRAEEAPAENRDLHDALQALRPQERIPVVLHYMEGYRTREIAGMLGLPESVVKWRLRAGRQRLKAELEDGGDLS